MKKFIAATLASLVMGGFVATAAADETAGQKLDDAAVVAKIKAELLKSPDVSGLAVNVDAKKGVVTLSGSARTEAERAKAADIAKRADGVAKVENKIVLKPDQK
jgi:osmotically-inducible protein OsmY